MRRPDRKRRAISSIIGTLFFILIVFVALTIFLGVFNSYSGYTALVQQYNNSALQRQETSLSISSFSFQNPSTSSTPSTVGTSTSQLTTSYSGDDKVVFAQGLWWVFYSDGTNIVYRTSTDGLTWSAATTVTSSTGSQYGYDFSIWQSGTTIYYDLCTPNSASQFYWRYGTMNSGGSITWSISEQTVHTSDSTNSYNSIAVDNSGNIWVAFNGNPHGSSYEIDVYEYSGGSWSLSNTYTSGTTSTTAPKLLPVTSGLVLLYGQGSSTNSIYRATFTGSAWSSAAVLPLVNDYAMFYSSATAIGNTVYFAGLSSASTFQTSGVVNFWNFTFNGAPTAEQTLESTTSSWSVSISQTSGALAVFYGSGSNIYYEVSTDSGLSWSSGNTISTTETSVTGLDASISNNGVVWVSGSGSPFNVRFSSIAVSWQIAMSLLNKSPFAVHVISLYLYTENSTLLTHFDTNASAPGVSGSFDYWVAAGEGLNLQLAMNWAHNQYYLVTIDTDTGVLVSSTYASPI